MRALMPSDMPGKAIWRLQNAIKRFSGWGSTPDPTQRSYSATPDAPAGGQGAAAPPKNHIPALSLVAGLGLRPFTYCCGMIKIADWQSTFAVLWFYVLLAYLP